MSDSPEAYTLPSPVFCLLLHLFCGGLRPSWGVPHGASLPPQYPKFPAKRCGLSPMTIPSSSALKTDAPSLRRVAFERSGFSGK
ncbi:hypothetical protein PoB_005329600 [Plakobranchus ocellatus]|uniref:Secreted protein n=1 Tax=Plakobranchus ocellatus TaxID=259542 RepID=A0AAV4C615_9GAST|nr:hypothetical protein PoB_005329600 [Plakobranchus ocellatus]